MTIDATIKSMVEQKVNQAVQTSHLGDTINMGLLPWIQLSKRINHQRINEAWNYKKIFAEEKDMNFTNWRFSNPSICEYQLVTTNPGGVLLKGEVLGSSNATRTNNLPVDVEAFPPMVKG